MDPPLQVEINTDNEMPLDAARKSCFANPARLALTAAPELTATDQQTEVLVPMPISAGVFSKACVCLRLSRLAPHAFNHPHPNER